MHVPFCRTKCVYCDFYSVTETDLVDAWLKAVEQEAALYGGTRQPFSTPSISAEARPASLAKRGSPGSSKPCSPLHLFLRREITVEANPDDATRSSLAFMKSLGVNRLSLGVQSFDDRELAFLKRRHDSARAQAAIGAAQDAGFSNIGLDLIYGLPGQTKKHGRPRSSRRSPSGRPIFRAIS